MEGSRDYSDACRRLRELLPPEDTTEERLGPAMDFLDEVKVRFHGKPENYRDFCTVVEKLTDFTIRLIASGQDLQQPQDLPWMVRKIFYGQEDLIDKFNSYLAENLRVSIIKAATVEAVAVQPATAEARPPTAAAAMADFAIKTSSAWCQRLQPTSGLDRPFHQVRNEDFLHRFQPVATGAEPPQPSIPLFLNGGLAHREEKETYHIRKNNNTRKAARVAVQVDGKLKEKLVCEKSRLLGWIEKRQRKLSSSSESYQQLLPRLYLYSTGKISSFSAEPIQCFPDITKEGRNLRPEVDKRPRPRPRPDEAELKCRKKRISASTPEKERLKAAVPQGKPLTVEAAKEPEVICGSQQMEKILPVRVEEQGNELKECLLSAAHYVDERMNGTDEDDDDDDDDGEDEEIGGGKGRIRFLRCMEAMYGDKGREMVEMVEAEPEKLLPMVRRRLHQKIGELESASQVQEVYPMATR